jgi:hypothetical protein
MMAHRNVDPLTRCTAPHGRMREYQNRPYVTSPSIARAHTGASSYCKERALNIPNKVKLWHKSAPLLITAVTILGLIVILHH